MTSHVEKYLSITPCKLLELWDIPLNFPPSSVLCYALTRQIIVNWIMAGTLTPST